jgi:hypothetical protein
VRWAVGQILSLGWFMDYFDAMNIIILFYVEIWMT